MNSVQNIGHQSLNLTLPNLILVMLGARKKIKQAVMNDDISEVYDEFACGSCALASCRSPDRRGILLMREIGGES
jgi:hypothetical protein